jgi:hypothetical protein
VSLTQVSREEATARQNGGAGSSRDLLIALMVQLQQNEAHLEELCQECELQRNQDRALRNQDRALIERHYRVHNENLKRIAMAPARVVGRSTTATATTATATTQMVNNHLGDPKAILSPNPRSLYLIWEEWTTGLNGNKPASQFTREENWKNKCKFCR